MMFPCYKTTAPEVAAHSQPSWFVTTITRVYSEYITSVVTSQLKTTRGPHLVRSHILGCVPKRIQDSWFHISNYHDPTK